MLENRNGAQVDILLVESCPERSRQVKDILVMAGVEGRLHRVGNVSEAIAYLRQDMPYFAAPTPNSVLIGELISQDGCCDLAGELRRNPRLGCTRLFDLDFEGTEPPGCASGECCAIKRVSLAGLVDRMIITKASA